MAIYFLAASPLFAREHGGSPAKLYVLSPDTQMQVHPVLIEASPGLIAAAVPAEASAVPTPAPDPAAQESSVTLYPAAPVDMTPGSSPENEQQGPYPGKLFGTDDSTNLFGYRGGFIHPSLLLREEWTDNLYNINENQQGNYLTVVSPGIWLGFPRMEAPPLNLSLNNSAIGGHRFLVTDSESFERFQGYLSAASDFSYFSANSDLNDTAWQAEGFAGYNMPVGLSLQILDALSFGRDRFDRGSFNLEDTAAAPQPGPTPLTPSFIRSYSSNLASAALEYTMSDRYSAYLNYSNFLIDYGEDDAWLNRSDNSMSMSLSYHLTPKTSFSAEYTYAVVSYDQFDANDSENTFVYAGIDWKGSSKISLAAKGGYQTRHLSNTIGADTGAYSMEVLFNYLVSDKTKISFSMYKALEETNTLGVNGMDTIAASLNYEQRFSYRFKGACALHYQLNDQDGFANPSVAPAEAPRKDSSFSFRPSLEYIFRDWLTAELAYAIENRASSNSRYDFTTQTMSLGLNFAL